jgi:hypothetical protein
MSQMDFEARTIRVRYNSADFGPHTFDFEEAIPLDTTLASVNCRAFEGKVKPGANLDDETEVSALIDGVLTAVTGDYVVSVYFDYPGDDYIANYTLVFEITLNNSAVHPYYFYKVTVE